MTSFRRLPWLSRLYGALASPRIIVVLAAVVLCIVLAAQYAAHLQARRDVLRVMQSTADTLARTLAASGEQAAYAMRTTEHAVLDLLMIKLRIVAELHLAGKLDQAAVDAYASATGLELIAFDSAGQPRLASRSAALLTNNAHAWLPALAPLLSGAVSESRIDLRPIAASTSYWRAVALRVPSGALALVPPPAAFAYRYSIGPGAMLQRLVTLPDLRYIVWQDDEGVIAAAGDISAADHPHPAVHEFTVPASVSFFSSSGGLFRVGISTEDLRRIHQQGLWRLVITAAVLAALTALAVQLALLRRKVAAERAQREHLASVSQLAAGVAHEVRNPLNAVALTLQQLQSDPALLNRDPDNATLLAVASSEIKRANATLSHFLEFARPPALARRPVNLNALCQDASHALAAAAAAQHVLISHDFQPLPDLSLDPDQLHQALLNLLINALEAMPHGGTITISTIARRSSVELRIADSGPGIPPAQRSRVFDLYYTTKHKGFGLGLPFVQRCIAMHGGAIAISSNKPSGACIIISLPFNL